MKEETQEVCSKVTTNAYYGDIKKKKRRKWKKKRKRKGRGKRKKNKNREERMNDEEIEEENGEND
jgi:hypothetical protein